MNNDKLGWVGGGAEDMGTGPAAEIRGGGGELLKSLAEPFIIEGMAESCSVSGRPKSHHAAIFGDHRPVQ